MKILFLAQQLPYPLDSGGKIKSYHFLKALSQRYEIVLLSFIRDEKEKEYLENLKPFCSRIETSLIKRSLLRNILFCGMSFLTSKSFIVSRDFTEEFQARVNQLIEEEKPDIIHIDHLQMAQFIQDLVVSSQDSEKEKTQNTDIKVVLDEHNVEYVIIERIGESSHCLLKKMFSAVESRNLKRFEKNVCKTADLVLTVTDKDKETLLELTDGEAKIKTVPIGVDTKYFRTSEHWSSASNTIVFIGTMFWPPNVDGMEWFISKIWPLLKQSSVKLQIIGRRPTKAIKALAEKDRSIELIEHAEDIRPYMQKGKLFIVPLRQGSGMRVKILNAFASGIPVVSTSIGAEGIEDLRPMVSSSGNETQNTNDENIVIADTAEEFAKAIMELISNDNLRKILSENARKLVEEKYSWEIIGKRLRAVYQEVDN